MSSGVTHPEALVRRDRETNQWVLIECPFCGVRNTHRHGSGKTGDLLGHRVPHCLGRPRGQYRLVDTGEDYVAESAPKPPPDVARLVRRAARDSGYRVRVWRADYGNRVTPLTASERNARGEYGRIAV